MFRKIIFMLMLLACCFCLDNVDTELVEEARAKKKKSPARLWVMLLLLALSKVAIIKVATFFFFMAFFQKLFYIAGLLVKYFLNSKSPKTPPATYGPPQEYNTVGYSYGPPEHEHLHGHNSLPSISEVGSSIGWLFNKNV